MDIEEELVPVVLFHLGPLQITSTVFNTWIMMAILSVTVILLGTVALGEMLASVAPGNDAELDLLIAAGQAQQQLAGDVARQGLGRQQQPIAEEAAERRQQHRQQCTARDPAHRKLFHGRDGLRSPGSAWQSRKRGHFMGRSLPVA